MCERGICSERDVHEINGSWVPETTAISRDETVSLRVCEILQREKTWLWGGKYDVDCLIECLRKPV